MQLVGGPDEARAERSQKALLPPLDRLHERARLVIGDRPERGQALAVTREAHRYHRRAGNRGVHARQLVHRAVEVRAIVPVRAEHDLRVHADARTGEALHHGQELALDLRPAEEAMAQLRVGRVDGDVERGEPLRLDALQLLLVEVGQRDVVAVQERQAEVVVLHVEALAHAARQLVDEAEDALVRAGRDLRRLRRLERQSPVGAPALEHRAPLATLADEPQANPRLPALEVKVDGVPERPAVDGHEVVARPEPGGRGRRPRAHARHDDARRGGGRGRAAHGVERPAAGAAGGLICFRPWTMYCRPDATVKPAVTHAKTLGMRGRIPK